MISTFTYFHYYLFRCFSKCLKTSKRQFRASWVRYYLFSFTIQVWHGSFNITYHIRTTQSTNNSQLYDILALYVQGKLLAINELKVCLCYRLNHPIIDLFLTSIPLLRILASGLQNTSYGLTLVLYQPK